MFLNVCVVFTLDVRVGRPPPPRTPDAFYYGAIGGFLQLLIKGVRLFYFFCEAKLASTILCDPVFLLLTELQTLISADILHPFSFIRPYLYFILHSYAELIIYVRTIVNCCFEI